MKARSGKLFNTALLPIVAACLLMAACGNDDQTAGAEAPVAPVDPTVESVVAALEKHHPSLNPQKTAHNPGDPVDASHQAAIERSEGFKDIRRKLHRQIGPCAFVCNGILTPMGNAVMARLAKLRDHGLDPNPYNAEGLKGMVQAFYAKTGMDKVTPPASAGPAGPVLIELLTGPLTKSEAVRRLQTAGGKPTPADVEALAAALAPVRASEDGKGDRAANMEIALAQAYLRLVLDFRFFKIGGPFEVTTKEEKAVQKQEATILELATELLKEPDAKGALDKLLPNDPQYKPILEVYKRYKTLADNGGCPDLPKAWTFAKGTKPGPEVSKLQKRLKCEGYFDFEPDQFYNNSTIDAVKTYQRTHNLEETGYVDAQTNKSLNIPMSRRADQARVALARMRERPTGALGDFYISVNLPAFELSVIMDGKVIRRHKVIIGSNKLDDDKHKLTQGHINRTALLNTHLYRIDVNPDWILPTRVSKGEMVGALEKNPNYMKDNNIKANTLPSGRKVYIQGPGSKNVLGKVKFLLTESNSIFLHDTNDPWLFRKSHRTFSHGCVRVEDAASFGRWLLERDGVDGMDIEQSFRAKKVQRGFTLNTPIPTMTVYRSVEVKEGVTYIYSDVYDYDEAFIRNSLPVVEKTRWGAARLRPRWVPKVPKKTVDQWRAQGKPAPRDLKPK